MILKICALAVLSVCAYVIVSYMSPSLCFAVKIAGAVLLGGGVLIMAEPMVSAILSFVREYGDIGEYAGVVIKAVGIALLSQICADICKDTGHTSAGSAVVLAAKMEIVLLCLPMVKKIIGYASEIMAVR